MSDPERCRAMAARYARMGEQMGNDEIRRSCLELEKIWLEMASLTKRLAGDDVNVRQRLYALIDNVEPLRREVMH
ncbi:hypothetical protein SAMN05216548_102309 [Faunimonas pinastri]|uniref:Uncharacterized protein n=1 Tax=Faunimonas pinastri TaxID=1855383 RepID=A0A1H9D0D3_9HYPH|nr:hypothetical protein [Faunimonas pinastri]SEQ06915.1 hypothetical protein SAMN05216548_102309 [Faunimonas pinastri]